MCLKTKAVELQNTDELKKFTDSTLIFRGTIPLTDAPENLFIISKKGDTVSLFTYHYYQDNIPRYTLITKEDTKQLSYYAPEDLEKVCLQKMGESMSSK